MSNRVESARWCWDIVSVHEIAIPMDKRAIHLVDKLNNYGQEGESIYSISRGALNKRMIDLANRLEPNFSSSKKSGMLLCLKLLYT
jgi:hypothetical protein